MRYPSSLKEKGCIGFAAPSYGASIEPYKSLFNRAVEVFSQMGYSVDLGPNCYEGKGIGISNTPKACGEELTRWYCRSENDVLISVGGGECMCETMDFVDWDIIKKSDPKWFMGYSDNTHFVYLLNTLCDTAAIYGPNASDFGMEEWHAAVRDAFDVLCGKQYADSYDLWEKDQVKSADNPYVGYNCTEKSALRAVLNGKAVEKVQAEGRLLGGCLDVLSNYAGTCFDHTKEYIEKYKDDGIIWFLEACDFSPMDVRRNLWRMKHCGWFENVKAFVFGRPYRYGEEFAGVTHASAVIDMLGEYGVPIILDADIGHLPPAMPIISGSYAKLLLEDKLHIDYIFR